MRESTLRREWQRFRQLIRPNRPRRDRLRRDRPRRGVLQAGFTLLELLLVTVIIGTLSTMAAPGLERARELAEVAAAVANIRILESELAIYIESNFEPPETLASIGRAGLVDPWGNPFMYKKLVGVNGNGGARKDKFQVPLNSDYDLYSMGKDGETRGPLTSPVSHDDVIRALDGSYIGLASEF